MESRIFQGHRRGRDGFEFGWGGWADLRGWWVVGRVLREELNQNFVVTTGQGVHGRLLGWSYPS